ncbi:MAG TPA: ThiF family adenylyltransferase [Phycisphaerae bacterium]|jgi:sulfur carrier protein ThiS adenylyltransferase|nr:ThiF family adenylyltransferase [Phycisphaerae bacterium]
MVTHANSAIAPGSLADRDLRQRELVPPAKLATCRITVVGVGAIGRQVALQLAAMGAPRIQLVDHDRVETVNLAPQGYFPADIGSPKVQATAALMAQVNTEVQVMALQERFRRSRPDHGNVVLLCVDSIETRRHIFDALVHQCDFLCDGRMSAEVLRVLTMTDLGSRTHYPTTLFAASEAFAGSCTAKSTLYCASVAAGLMVGQFTQWLRGLSCQQDMTLNLLSSELIVP